MEVYKFYINSLYVAITRAIKSVYLIEKNPHHPLMSLLNINEINQTIQLDIAESSIDEWQKEASRLASQGKAEQATAINEIILKQKTPPWAVIDKMYWLAT
jgi:ATP-dependent exoDNAse (exonuclease V) beta subunit